MTPETTYEKTENEEGEFTVVRTVPVRWHERPMPEVRMENPNETIPPYIKYTVMETKEEILKFDGPERGWADMDHRFCDECWVSSETADLAITRLKA